VTTADLLIHNADLVLTMDEERDDLPGGWRVRDSLGPVGSDSSSCGGAVPVRCGTGAR
jgi:hypothetical protein